MKGLLAIGLIILLAAPLGIVISILSLPISLVVLVLICLAMNAKACVVYNRVGESE